MKKNKLKYVLIPAFTTAAMFPIFADNNAKASDESTTVAATQPAAQPTTQPTFQKEPKEISNKIPMTVSEYKQKSALELAQLIREKKVTSEELVNLAYKTIDQ
mgnify:FL=1